MVLNSVSAAARPVHASVRRAPSAVQRILVVEDDRPLAEGMIRILEGFGYAVSLAVSGEEALTAISDGDFDAMVLDIGLPGIDGFQVLEKIDPERNFAVLVVSAYDRVEQRVHGLNLGADDYLVKPFAIEEFEARIRALLRRSQLTRHARIELGDLVVDLVAKRAWISEEPLELTAREWSVLNLLLARIGQVVSKDQLQQTLGSDQQTLSDNAIEVYISRLRAKLGSAGVNIRTLRGFGYMIEEPRVVRP